MNSFNSVVVDGYLVGHPLSEALLSGETVIRFSLQQVRDDGEGGSFEREAWKKTGDLILKTLHAGHGIRAIGRLKSVSWDEKGQRKSRTVIVVETFERRPKLDLRRD
jgi:single-stranded DNA-binding protein